ncbi:hypothetical protein DOE51_12840 [Bdellovibrio sp. NC01]|nr:hypothetical protein DOE51_12840 [Bdellovibrio sp. NC01]
MLATGFIGCASTPPNAIPIAQTANPAAEIEKTQKLINEARERQMDVLSPTNFTKAEQALNKAIDKKSSGKSNEDILEQISYSRTYLKQAADSTQLAIRQLPGIQDARRGAMIAGANEAYPRDWNRVGKELESVTKSIEKGNLSPSDKKSAAIIGEYRQLEIDAVTKRVLSQADNNLKAAEKDKAEKMAPRSYTAATMKYQNAAKIIAANPRNAMAINKASQDATRESLHLVEVMNKVKQGNTEDLVLQSEKQQRAISSLRKENNMNEAEMNEMARQQAELQRSQMLINQAANIRSQFKPSEAEVFTEKGRVTLRLKSLQFPPNQASLGRKNEALLERVNEAIETTGPARVIVEGHTDSTGNPNRNMTLSERRAKSVQDYLVANGAVTLANVEAVGLGSTKPVSDNKTATGRAQNRRIEIIIEPLSR